MEAAFFRDVANVNIRSGNFIMNNGPDNSRKTITHHHHATTINDRSRRITNYGGYTNFGQHADGNGQINNYGPQTTNHGPIHGYRQYASSRSPYAKNNWPPSSYDDDNFNDDFQAPVRGPYQQPVQPDRLRPGERDYSGRYQPASQSDPRLQNRPKEPDLPRSKTDLPNRPPKGGFDMTSPRFRDEYKSLSPQMKAYFRDLGFDPQESLTESMANINLGDPGLSYGRRTPDAPRKGKNVAPLSDDSDDSDEEEEEEFDEDYDSKSGRQQYPSLYTHNDNRVITKNINSHNVNTENVVDSYNDNSTRTDINKNSAR